MILISRRKHKKIIQAAHAEIECLRNEVDDLYDELRVLDMSLRDLQISLRELKLLPQITSIDKRDRRG